MRKCKSNPNQPQLFDPDTFEVEIWKPVPGFDGRYEASNKGRVRCVQAGKGWLKHTRIISPFVQKNGYRRLVLWSGKGQHSIGVHQVVAMAFIGPCPDGCEVNHIDCDKTNNCPENLEYITHRENMKHARRANRWDSEAHRAAVQRMRRLTDEQVREIRVSTSTQRELGRRFGISQEAINCIKSRKTYRDVE